MNERWSAFDLAEGFHLSHAIATLHEEGILQSLRHPQTAAQLVADHPFDLVILRALLQYVAARTDLLEQRGDEFATTKHYEARAQFLIGQYVGTYGSNARQLPSLLRNPSLASGMIDRSRHAQAYAHLEAPGLPILPSLILQLELNHLLDLGCGPGSLLVRVAQKDTTFRGWGVDMNPWMCSIARERVRAAGLDERLLIFEGDCTNLEAVVPADIRDLVETISAVSLVNEFFGHDTSPVIAWLQKLRTLFPERALLLSDYYGRLGRTDPPWPRHTILHDFVQTISGQGIPPSDRATWSEIYAAAGCTLIHTVEDEKATFFVHILRL